MKPMDALQIIDRELYVACDDKEYMTDEVFEALTAAWDSLEKEVNNTCHNNNEDYADCDQFVCSRCGIELQDWHRVERDEDDGDITYHEYTFKYCPNCGRKVEE